MEKIVDYNAYKKEWLEEIDNNSSGSQNASDRFAERLFSQWLDIDETSEDFYSLNNIGFSFAYYHEGSPEEENSSEEYIWYIVYSNYKQSDYSIFFDKIKELNNFLILNPNSQKDGIIFEINKFTRKVKKDPLANKITLVITTDNEELFREYNQIKNQIDQYELFSFEIISIRTIHNRILDENERSADFYINANLTKFGKNLLVGSIPLKHLYEFLLRYRNSMGDLDLIYQKNVRRYLGSKNKVNKEIRNTILNNPESFGLYNNGITMVVGNFDDENPPNFPLIEPYIVNGCQTSKTIWETLTVKYRDKNKDTNFKDWEDKLKISTVILKIVDIGSGKDSKNLLRDITKYTNSQSTVKTSDFISLEDDFNLFHKQMAEEYNVYLEIQKGGWTSQRSLQENNQTIKPFFKDDEFCNAFDLIKVYASGWLEEPGKASGTNPPFAPGGSIFKEITDSNQNKINVKDLYACYLLHREANEIKFGRDARDSWKARTKYLFYFTIIKILNDILIKLEFNPEKNKKIITESIIHLFIKYPELKTDLVKASLDLIEEYMTHGKEDSIFTEPDFNRYKEIKDFFKLDKVGKTDIFKTLLKVQLRAMKRAVNGIIPYDIILDKIKELKK